MKTQIIVFLFIFLSMKGYCQIENDSVQLPSLKYFNVPSDNNNFNKYEYSYDLKKQLLPYLLKIDGINTDNTYPISLKDYYFKDYYNIYNNNLGRFIPKPPDITKQSIPFAY